MTHSNDAPAVREVKDAINDLGHAFEAFKQTNDSAEIEKRTKSGVDALVTEKVARINSDIDRLQKSINQMHAAGSRPRVGNEEQIDPATAQHKTAFYDRYMRKGMEADIATLEAKSLNITTAADGGYTVPQELDASIEKRLVAVSPIRAIANVVQIGTSGYKKLVTVSGAASGWVGEAGARTETTAPQFAEVTPPLGELYANPAATQSMLDDAYFDVENWLADELVAEFGQKEGASFVSGDGSDKPKGFLSYSTAAQDDSARAFGTLEHMITGVSGDFPAADPSDILIDLVHSLKAGYRQNAAFVMNTDLVAEIRKMKDVDGQYLWRPGLENGAVATLLGYPVVEAADMPAMGAGSLSIAFGNFQRGYTVTDRMGTRVLRDPFSNKPYVHFYATRRVGGGVVNSDAIKLLKFSAT